MQIVGIGSQYADETKNQENKVLFKRRDIVMIGALNHDNMLQKIKYKLYSYRCRY